MGLVHRAATCLLMPMEKKLSYRLVGRMLSTTKAAGDGAVGDARQGAARHVGKGQVGVFEGGARCVWAGGVGCARTAHPRPAR